MKQEWVAKKEKEEKKKVIDEDGFEAVNRGKKPSRTEVTNAQTPVKNSFIALGEDMEIEVEDEGKNRGEGGAPSLHNGYHCLLECQRS